MITDDSHFIIDKKALYAYAQSYVPITGRFIGNLIPHEETYTIGKTLTVYDNDKIIYKPSIYYVYSPCNDAKLSLEELKDRNLIYQDAFRLLTKEILSGRDQLGLTFFLSDNSVYWIGSLLGIDEARQIYENKFDSFINATIVQVMIGYLSALIYLLELIEKGEKLGLLHPDDLPYQKIIDYCLPFLGEFIFRKVDDFVLYNVEMTVTGETKVVKGWQFENFCVYNK
jgi:homospermidine synthase